jgi:hypothetical protein
MGRALSTLDAVGSVGSALHRKKGVNAAADVQFCARLHLFRCLGSIFLRLAFTRRSNFQPKRRLAHWLLRGRSSTHEAPSSPNEASDRYFGLDGALSGEAGRVRRARQRDKGKPSGVPEEPLASSALNCVQPPSESG